MMDDNPVQGRLANIEEALNDFNDFEMVMQQHRRSLYENITQSIFSTAWNKIASWPDADVIDGEYTVVEDMPLLPGKKD